MRLNIATGVSTSVKNPVGDGRGINALGYNVADNYLYGSIGSGASTNLIRIGANGDSAVFGSVGFTVNGGDVNENSYFWATDNGNRWVQIDLRPLSPTYGLLGAAFADAYLTQFSRATKTWRTLTDYGNIVPKLIATTTWESVYYSGDQALHALEKGTGQVWRFSLPGSGSSTATKVGTGKSPNGDDGARCVNAKAV